MFSPTSPFLGGTAFGSGGSPGVSGRDIVWVDLRFPPGVGVGTEELPFNTANIGIGALPSGGTLVMVGGDASAEPGINIAAGSAAFIGWGGQKASGGLTPVLPTLTYAITTGTQRLAFRNISVALVHSGTVASLSDFEFFFCPTVTLTAGGDASPVSWIGAPGNIFSGSGGAAQFIGGTIAGYVANGAGSVIASGCNITSDLTSSSSITLVGACTFGGALSITAPVINIDLASLYNASVAGVTFSTTVHLLVPFGTPSDIGTANSTGTATTMLPSDHVHRLTFTTANAAIATADAPININGQKITGAGAPTIGTDLVTKTYADAIAVGLKVKTPAVAVATANQATLSGTAQTIDGVVLNTIGMRVLLTAQTTATQNGPWVVASGAWTRPTDFATGSGAAQSYVLVTGGTANAGSSYFCTNATGSDVVDTASLTWVLFSQSATVTAHNGLTKTGNQLDVVAGDATIVVSVGSLVVGVIGNANLADNTIALTRLVNASAQNHFVMRKTASGGAWEDGSATDARSALGVFMGGALAPCRAATTANITLSGTQNVDGVALIAGDRCLAKNQTTGSQNGPYVVASGAWTRATDADGAGELVGGQLFPISEGTANGNQVAMLTTDDPITIGTTALTFAMGRAAALGAVAPLDVTNGAAQVGTSTLGTPIDHVHSLAVATVIALLATASSSISVNSQKITSLANGVLSTDAATVGQVTSAVSTAVGTTVAPLNSGDNNKVAYAFGGAIVYASAVKTDGTYLSIGGTPATSGDIRGSYGFSIKAGNHSGAGVPYSLIQAAQVFGVDDSVLIGDNAAAKIESWVSATGSYLWRFNGNLGLTVAPGGITYAQQAVTSGTAPLLLSITGAAHTGLTASTEPRDATFALNRTVTMAAGALTSARAVRFQAPTYAFASASTISVAATVAIGGAPGAGANATINNSVALWVEGGGIANGATPARSGAGRYTSNTFLNWRNATGTPDNVDLKGIGYDGTDNFIVGDNTNGAATYVDCASAGGVHLRVGANVYDFTSTALTTNNKNVVIGTGFASIGGTVSTQGAVRLAASSGVGGVWFRNNGNSADLAGMYSGTDDVLYLGDPTNGAGLNLRTKSSGFANFYFGGTAEYQLSPSSFNFTDNAALFGTSPASAGTIRLQNDVGLIAWNGVSALAGSNVLGMYLDSANAILIGAPNGGFVSPANTAIYAAAGGGVFHRIGTSDVMVSRSGGTTITQLAVSSGTAPVALTVTGAAHTGLTASTEPRDITFALNRTVTMATGALATARAAYLQAPTYAFGGASTLTTAATVAISGAPVAGSNATITRGYALLIENNGIGFGSTPATTALINTPVSSTIIAAKHPTSGDIAVVATNSSGEVLFGSSTAVNAYLTSAGNIFASPGSTFFIEGSGGAHEWSFGATGSFPGVAHTIASGGSLAIATSGSPTATSGALRLSYNNTISARDSLNSVDVALLQLDSSSNVILGDASNGNIEMRVASLYNIKAGGSVVLQMTSSSIIPYKDIAFSSQGNIKSIGYLEIDNMTAPSAPGVLGWRLYCDNSTGDLIAKSNTGVTRVVALH